MLDDDEDGNLAGIDNASKKLDLSEVVTSRIRMVAVPLRVESREMIDSA